MSHLQQNWDIFALHTWLISSSFGIIFAIISFLEDLGLLSEMKLKFPWIKGLLAIFVGILFYVFIGLRHLEGAKLRH